MNASNLLQNSNKKHKIYCAVENCGSKSNVNVDLSYHTFPRRGQCSVAVSNYFDKVEKIDLRDVWQKATKVRDPNRHTKICSRHFKADDYHLPGKCIGGYRVHFGA